MNRKGDMKGRKKDWINIRQQDNSDCGSACLCSILGYWGLRVPHIEVRHACGVSQRGCSIHSIVIGARKFGMEAYGAGSKSKEILELKDISVPIILHLRKENGWLHFVVYYGYSGKNALIMDPEYGKISKVPFDNLAKMWSGHIISITPSAQFIKGDSTAPLMQRLRILLRENLMEIILSGIGAIAFIALTYSFSLFLQYAIDIVIPSEDLNELSRIGIIMILLTIVISVVGTLRGTFLLRASLKIDCHLITTYIRKLMHLPLSFFDGHTPAELNSRISDAYRIRTFVANRSILMVVNIISLCCTTLLLISFNWKLALISLSLTPLTASLYQLSSRLYEKYNKMIIESLAHFQEESIETLNNIRSLKNFNSGPLAMTRIDMAYIRQSKAQYKGGIVQNIIAGISEGISKLTSTLIITIGSWFCIKGELSLGELVSFYTIASLFNSSAILLIDSTKDISQAKISSRRLFEITDLKEEEDDALQTYKIPMGDILFENVTFAYPGGFTLFDNLSIRIKRGEINIIRGENGSGKSTIGKLLLRSYNPDKGRITIGNIDISLISLHLWRENIVTVPQIPEILNGTLLENIILDKECDLEKVYNICNECGLTTMIQKLPDGILSNLGESGHRISGGEKEKISIARALYRDPQIIIIDEGSSHLDKENKINFYRQIKKLHSKSITIILITHDEIEQYIKGNTITIKKPEP